MKFSLFKKIKVFISICVCKIGIILFLNFTYDCDYLFYSNAWGGGFYVY